MEPPARSSVYLDGRGGSPFHPAAVVSNPVGPVYPYPWLPPGTGPTTLISPALPASPTESLPRR